MISIFKQVLKWLPLPVKITKSTKQRARPRSSKNKEHYLATKLIFRLRCKVATFTKMRPSPLIHQHTVVTTVNFAISALVSCTQVAQWRKLWLIVPVVSDDLSKNRWCRIESDYRRLLDQSGNCIKGGFECKRDDGIDGCRKDAKENGDCKEMTETEKIQKHCCKFEKILCPKCDGFDSSYAIRADATAYDIIAPDAKYPLNMRVTTKPFVLIVAEEGQKSRGSDSVIFGLKRIKCDITVKKKSQQEQMACQASFTSVSVTIICIFSHTLVSFYRSSKLRSASPVQRTRSKTTASRKNALTWTMSNKQTSGSQRRIIEEGFPPTQKHLDCA